MQCVQSARWQENRVVLGGELGLGVSEWNVLRGVFIS